jgi:hypothetical protein
MSIIGKTRTVKTLPDTIRPKQLAAKLGVSERYIQNLMYSGKLRYFKPTSRMCLIDLDSVRALFATPENAAVLQGGE